MLWGSLGVEVFGVWSLGTWGVRSSVFSTNHRYHYHEVHAEYRDSQVLHCVLELHYGSTLAPLLNIDHHVVSE